VLWLKSFETFLQPSLSLLFLSFNSFVAQEFRTFSVQENPEPGDFGSVGVSGFNHFFCESIPLREPDAFLIIRVKLTFSQSDDESLVIITSEIIHLYNKSKKRPFYISVVGQA
jgi:hypothetical protein